jgi:acyl-CoA reductase-like NAD-dependent aldehyde dehydrogenase
MTTIRQIPNWIDGKEILSVAQTRLKKINPHSGMVDAEFFVSSAEDVRQAVGIAHAAFPAWSSITPVARGSILGAWVRLMRERQPELADIVARETGKPPQDAMGEVGGAIAQGEYFAGEGMRLYGRSLTSGMPNKHSHTVRQARGVAGLIVPANTPIANIAWKVFPALICGNPVVLKASEDAPEIALRMAQLAAQAGLPSGVLNVIQGSGDPTGRALVEDPRIAVVSFTGSTSVGRWIAEIGGRRLARVSLELGGKNAFVVCGDADIEAAVHWASLSAFSNAGQRCAAGSRILVADAIYDAFVEKLVVKAKSLKLGILAGCDLGPVMNQRQQANIFAAIGRAVTEGGRLLCGGKAPETDELKNGCYVEPTLIDQLPENAELCQLEIFGPVATVQRVRDVTHALQLGNSSEYGLTAAVHTRSVDTAMWFAQRVRAGVVNINIGTYGSEPHMPFGGFGASGNGTREPGIEALDVYSEIKNISVLIREWNM